jgi:hypothetical protein
MSEELEMSVPDEARSARRRKKEKARNERRALEEEVEAKKTSIKQLKNDIRVLRKELAERIYEK